MITAMTASQGTAVICGALSIIGMAYAEHLARNGFDLLLIGQHRVELIRLAESLTTRTRRAVEVVVVKRGSAIDISALTAQIEQDASISVVVNIASPQGHTLLSDRQAHALINGDGSEQEITRAAIRRFLSRRGVVSTYRADVSIAAAGNIAEFPPLI